VSARILVVAVEPVVAMDLRQRLTERGYVVVGVVGSAEAAVEKVAAEEPDLILMDIMLSGERDGIDAATRIRGESSVPIVYLTAYADDATIERAKRTDASGYVVKPFRDRELHATIQVALQRHTHERQGEKQLHRMVRALSALKGTRISVEPSGTVTWAPLEGEGQATKDALQRLTKRERGVLREVLSGAPLEGAAGSLGISRHTVRNHLKAIFRKLGVHSQAELLRQYQLADLPPEA